MKNNRNGSVLVLVLLIAVTSGMILTSLSQLAITEKRLNDHSRDLLEAKEAAEAAVECGFAQLVERFESRNSFPVNALSPSGGNPLILTDDFYSLFQTGSGMTLAKVRMPPHPYNPQASWGSLDTEVIGGQILPGEWKFIDGRVPGNEFDPLRDKLVFIREVEVVGKATVQNPSTGYAYTAYVSQNLQVRDAPLFAHAIFYNMDMEIAPGPTMSVRGSVHANGEMFIQANNRLDFHRNVSATGQLFHGPNPEITKATAGGTVRFSDGLGDLVRMDRSGSWIDSRMGDFRSVASNRWNGNVQAYEHGIQNHNPVAIDPYVADNPDTVADDDPLNYAYQLIQPLNRKDDPTYNPEIEHQKFAYKAGMVIHIEASQVENVISSFPVTPDYGDEAVQEPFFEVANSGRDPSAQPVTIYRYDHSSGYEEIDYNNDGTPKIDPFNSFEASDHFMRIKPFAASGSTVESGIYDQRMRAGINLIEIDVGKLKEVVEGNEQSYWGNAGKAANNPSALPENWWNGVVYVEVSTNGAPSDRPDNVVVAEDGWGVKLVNGEKIPNPGFSWTDDLYGTTIATNVPMYVEGNYNADGDPSTGSATEADVNDVLEEPPAALVADAVTILSNSWDDADSLKNTSTRSTNAFTEVAAAILTGLVPSDKNGWNNYSGGVENFPRFLEDWNTTLRYRGSMVALFESEVATEPWGKSNVYGA
ncbi:MAG: hypothetical protein R6V45_12575, partial [Oceanipulchritudo sp.]